MKAPDPNARARRLFLFSSLVAVATCLLVGVLVSSRAEHQALIVFGGLVVLFVVMLASTADTAGVSVFVGLGVVAIIGGAPQADRLAAVPVMVAAVLAAELSVTARRYRGPALISHDTIRSHLVGAGIRAAVAAGPAAFGLLLVR